MEAAAADVLSRLPTDLLVSVLFRLTLKQAIATSVLSRRWEKLWTFYHGTLDFEVSKDATHDVGCSNHVKAVNKVLDAFKLVQQDAGGFVFDSFIIRFHACPTILSSADTCVRFAWDNRRVKRLVFDPYHSYYGCNRGGSTSYCLPPASFYARRGSAFQTLTDVCFDSVDVSCEIIEKFLARCPLLESLKLVGLRMPRLVRLRVSGQTLALRHLIVMYCLSLAAIEISAPNLVSFMYRSFGTTTTNAKVYVQNAPKLVEISIGTFKNPMRGWSLELLTCISRIQKLELFICDENPGNLIELVEMTSVRHLTLTFRLSHGESMVEWIPLLEAFPALQKLTLDMRFPRNNTTNGMLRYL